MCILVRIFAMNKWYSTKKKCTFVSQMLWKQQALLNVVSSEACWVHDSFSGVFVKIHTFLYQNFSSVFAKIALDDSVKHGELEMQLHIQ